MPDVKTAQSSTKPHDSAHFEDDKGAFLVATIIYSSAYKQSGLSKKRFFHALPSWSQNICLAFAKRIKEMPVV